MPQTFFCPECDVHWSPHMTNNGACPECGSGTRRRTMQGVSDDAYVRSILGAVEREYRLKQDAFDAFIANRETT